MLGIVPDETLRVALPGRIVVVSIVEAPHATDPEGIALVVVPAPPARVECIAVLLEEGLVGPVHQRHLLRYLLGLDGGERHADE